MPERLQHLLAKQPTAATLMADIKSGDSAIRLRAVEQSVLIGAPLIVPLGVTLGGADPAAAKAALEALRRVAHHCARPRSGNERQTAARELTKLTGASFPRSVRREALHLLGLVGRAESVGAIAALLEDADVREDARLALERIPDAAAERAIRRAAEKAHGDFRSALDLSLSARKRHRRP